MNQTDLRYGSERRNKREEKEKRAKNMRVSLWVGGPEIAWKCAVSATLCWHASWSGVTGNSWLTHAHSKDSWDVIKYQILDGDRKW